VVRSGPWLEMRVNGKVDASTRRDLETETFLGHLAVFLHPEPERVLVLGFGSGITAASVLAHREVGRVDCVEIEPAVVEGGLLFRPWNRGVLGSPRLRLTLGDGRALMARSPGAYDLVVSQPSNPWVAGMADLFTREAFEAGSASLRPGGVFVQWVQAYRFAPEDLRAVVRTFLDVFPGATLWALDRGHGDLALVGGGPSWDASRVEGALAGAGDAARELRAAGILGPADCAARLLAAGRALKRLAGEGPRLTDDHPWIEYTAPLALHDEGLYPKVLELLLAHRSRPAEALVLEGEEAEAAGRLHGSHTLVLEALAVGARGDTAGHERLLRRALALAPWDTSAAFLLSRLLTDRALVRLEEGREAEAVGLLEEAVRTDPNHADPWLTLGLLHERRGETFRAAWDYGRYLDLYPHDPAALERLAGVKETLGEAGEAGILRRKAQALRPSASPR